MELTAFAAWLNSAFGGYDRVIFRFLHSLAEAIGVVLTPLMKLITFLGEKGLVLILISLVLMLFSRTRRTGICMFGAIACGAILTNFILKDWVARPRPFESMTVYRQWWEALGAPAEDGFSFPSGHVTAAVAGLTGLCLTRGRKWILPSVIWVLLMAVSRNYLMAHFPSDVLFAVLIGLLAAAIAYAVTLLIYRLLGQHTDKPVCAAILGSDVPLRLPAGKLSSLKLPALKLPSLKLPFLHRDEEEEEDAPAAADEYLDGEPDMFYDDAERIDIAADFDQIMQEKNTAAAAPQPAAAPASDEAAEEAEEPNEGLLSFLSRPRSSGGYQGKHLK